MISPDAERERFDRDALLVERGRVAAEYMAARGLGINSVEGCERLGLLINFLEWLDARSGAGGSDVAE